MIRAGVRADKQGMIAGNHAQPVFIIVASERKKYLQQQGRDIYLSPTPPPRQKINF